MPYIDRDAAWPHTQITDRSPNMLARLLLVAGDRYDEPKYVALAGQILESSDRHYLLYSHARAGE